MNEAKTILVTGGAGFIGSNTVEALLDQGHTVISIDNFNTYYNPKQKEINVTHFHRYSNFVQYRGDLKDRHMLDTIFHSYDIDKVCHLAASAGVRGSIENPDLYIESNIRGTLNLLEAMREAKVTDMVFGSSSSVYGNSTETPFHEEQPVDRPISPYAATKHAGELILHTYHHLYQMHITCLRFFTVYGPAGRPDMAPYKFMKWILEEKSITRYGDGTTKRDYTYIDDIVTGILRALDNSFGFEVINLGNHTPVTLNNFIETIETVTEKTANIEEQPMQPGDVEVTCADTTKAKKLLGFEPETSLEEGMRRFYKWFQSDKRVI